MFRVFVCFIININIIVIILSYLGYFAQESAAAAAAASTLLRTNPIQEDTGDK